MSWTISQLATQQGYASTIYDADVMIINNLGVTKAVTVSTLKLTFQGTAFVLDATGANNTIPVFRAIAANAPGAAGYTNIDLVLSPKGNGGVSLSLPDNIITGGNKRGRFCVDLQTQRAAANQVAGADYSNVLGGQNNGTLAQFTVIGGGFGNSLAGSSPYSVICGGNTNTMSGSTITAFIGGGTTNTISLSGISAVCVGGSTNTVSAQYGVCGGGFSNTVDGTGATIPGGQQATTRGINGIWAYSGGRFSVNGDSQISVLNARVSTASATPARISSDGAAATSTNQLVMPNNSAYLVFGQVVARNSSTGDAAAYQFNVLIRRGANAAATALVGAPAVTTLFNDAGAAAWSVAISADTTLGCLNVSVTGAAATNIKWSSRFQTVEVVG